MEGYTNSGIWGFLEPRECICNYIGLALDVFDVEVILSKAFSPVSLLAREVSLCLEVLKSTVVGIDCEVGT